MSSNRHKRNKQKTKKLAQDAQRLADIAAKQEEQSPNADDVSPEQPAEDKAETVAEIDSEKAATEQRQSDEAIAKEHARVIAEEAVAQGDDSDKDEGDSDEKDTKETPEPKKETPEPKKETPEEKPKTQTESLLQRYRKIMALNIDVTRSANRNSQITMQREFADHVLRECASNTSPIPRITTLINAMRDDKTFGYRFVTRHVFDDNLVRRISLDYEITIHLLAMAAEHDVAYVINHVDVDKSLSRIVNKGLRANLSAMFSN